jgi:hypothetical protein
MWKGRLVMMSFAGLGDATGGGEVSGGGESAGVGAVLGVVVTGRVEGVASGEVEVCWLVVVGTQPANAKIIPATNAAGTDPAHTLFSRTLLRCKVYGRLAQSDPR